MPSRFWWRIQRLFHLKNYHLNYAIADGKLTAKLNAIRMISNEKTLERKVYWRIIGGCFWLCLWRLLLWLSLRFCDDIIKSRINCIKNNTFKIWPLHFISLHISLFLMVQKKSEMTQKSTHVYSEISMQMADRCIDCNADTSWIWYVLWKIICIQWNTYHLSATYSQIVERNAYDWW